MAAYQQYRSYDSGRKLGKGRLESCQKLTLQLAVNFSSSIFLLYIATDIGVKQNWVGNTIAVLAKASQGHGHEGRVINLELEDYYLVTVYTPNSQKELARLSYRMEWEVAFRQFLQELDKKKPVIVCGDLNVAHTEIDLKNPRTNHKNAGFTDEERGKFEELLAAGFTDTFRYIYPDVTGAYTWWSYLRKARANNSGWRIDYFLTSNRLQPQIKSATIYNEIFGSDHCPVGLELS